MTWKTEIQLIDLGPDQKLEATCTVCSHSYYPNVHALIAKQGMDMFYIDEVERNLVCQNPGCSGAIRLSLSHAGDTEGFVAGLA